MMLKAYSGVHGSTQPRAGRVERRAIRGAVRRLCPLMRNAQGRAPLRTPLCEASAEPGTATTSAPVRDGKFEITLKGLEALQTVRLGLVPDGRGQAVVVTEVAEGSRAEELGVTRGMKMNALSDPIRYGELWDLQDRPSLRFVVDTFKMRRNQPIDLQFEPMMKQSEMDIIFGPSGASSSSDDREPSEVNAQAAASGSPSPSPSGAASPARVSLDQTPDSPLGSVNSIDQLLGTVSDSEETIGDKLALKYQEQQRIRVAVNQVQKRIDRRKEYMAIDDQRDDTGLLLGLAAAFLIPPLIILIIAFASGYLDQIYLTSLGMFRD
ncbi:hypothetical protein CHLRE_16g668600v5 [Chlamydomonas reinhardtii]|uniref:PDZ domain-containing protein n=1 Tax=Chlamydomonas reinhardtii TaxID=3055 RepID=A8JB36_CHLRE|nr:uncharacterized protein CHLRE_16g668600v5 [Chlamydomonas reinhardtii]PNW71897.1 hypothetical protein CHLRE_16g668600v5 [Chlamydomonas reinhardtii]|eukprot:XP_001699165.1 predicted protein [Chlamydomonas reinhardtii]